MIDLHSHSNRSDGALSPSALVQRAAARGVRALALTDHDTLDGLAEASTVARQHSLVLVAGVEVSVTWSGRTLHVIGLDIDPEAPVLRAGLSAVRSGRVARAQAIGARLERLGIPGAFDGAITLATNRDMVGRAHFARHMVAAGVVKDMGSAFRRYLGEGKSAFVRHTWAELQQAVDWIRAAGGVAVLAHPGRYGLRAARLRALMTEFRTLGGVAVEVLCASHGPDQVQLISQLANECGLFASAGSDFHCPDESWLDVGQLAHLPACCEPVWRHPNLRGLAALQ